MYYILLDLSVRVIGLTLYSPSSPLTFVFFALPSLEISILLEILLIEKLWKKNPS